MPFTRQQPFSKKVTDLPDKPTSAGYTPSDIKTYIETPDDENKSFIDSFLNEIESTTDGDSGADNIGATGFDGTASNPQAMLEDLNTRKAEKGTDWTGTWQGFNPSQVDQTLNDRVNTNTSQLADIAVDIKNYFLATDTKWTQAFIRAIADLNTKGGGTIIVYKGDYLIDPDQILLESNIKIQGNGFPRIYTNYGSPYVFMMGRGNDKTVENIEITGLMFDQINEVGKFIPTTNVNPTRCISFYSSKNVNVHHNLFMNLFGQHAVIVNGDPICERTFIKNNYVLANRKATDANPTEFYDASAFYCEDKYHEIEDNIIDSINTGYKYWKILGGIETHGMAGSVQDNKMNNVAIGVNVVNHFYTTGDKGKRVIKGNNILHAGAGIKFWSINQDGGISNVDVEDNYILLESTADDLGLMGIGTTKDNDGRIENVNVHDNTIEHVGNISDYTGTNVFSSTDVSAIQFFNAKRMYNVKVKHNTIKNFPGTPFALNQSPQDPNEKHKKIWFDDNVIIDCGYYNFNDINFNTIFDVEWGDEIYIRNNDVSFENAIYPQNYGISLLRIGDGTTVTNLEYNNNRLNKYGNFSVGYVRLSDYNGRRTLSIDMEYLRQFRTDDFRLSYITNQNPPTKGNYYLEDRFLYVGSTAIANFRGYTCTGIGTAGTNDGTASRVSNNCIQMVTGSYQLNDMIYVDGFPSTVLTIVAINGDHYYTMETVPTFTGTVGTHYKNPSWATNS